jgi:Zinc carboxypeptidase
MYLNAWLQLFIRNTRRFTLLKNQYVCLIFLCLYVCTPKKNFQHFGDIIFKIDLYPTTGTADDWFYMQKMAYKNQTIQPYSLTIELRPSESYIVPGFILDPEEIIPTGEEILSAVIELAQTAIKYPLQSQ